MKRKLIAFDLDGTLAVSKSPVSDRMALQLRRLLESHDVCVISGGAYPQFKTQLVDRLGACPAALARLHLMPVSGTSYYRFDPDKTSWVLQYEEAIDPATRTRIQAVLAEEAQAHSLWEAHPAGEIIEDRISQVTFSALGQHATPEAKEAWDPDDSKKFLLRDAVAAKLPGLQVKVGGSTSIDVTNAGVDKGYGIRKLMGILGLSMNDILFFGDKLEEGGNDYPVKAIGVDTIAVAGWEQTAVAVEAITCLS